MRSLNFIIAANEPKTIVKSSMRKWRNTILISLTQLVDKIKMKTETYTTHEEARPLHQIKKKFATLKIFTYLSHLYLATII